MSARILIIEDNPTNLELMRYLLETFGHTVVAACDGSAGLALARTEAPDLIICDIHLPKLDGFAVIASLKECIGTRRLPVIAVTAQAMVGDRDKLIEAGFDGYLCKPIEPEFFVKQVDAFLPAQLRSAKPLPSVSEFEQAAGSRSAQSLQN